MPVNNFEFEKADGIISSIKGQSVGRDPISAAGIFNFVSIAQKGFGEKEADMILFVYPENGEIDLSWNDLKDVILNDKKIIVFVDDGEPNVVIDYVEFLEYDDEAARPYKVHFAGITAYWYAAATADAPLVYDD